MIDAVNISGLFKTIAGKVSAKLGFPVYFQHGVYDAVKKELIAKDGGITSKGEKYPLVWLVTPVQALLAKSTDAACELPDLQLFIITGSESDITEDAHIDKYFAPILRPIYLELLRQIDASYFFQVLSPEAIPHEMIEWSYQSTTDGKTNLFNDIVDCIQIKRMRLLVNESVPADFKFLTH